MIRRLLLIVVVALVFWAGGAAELCAQGPGGAAGWAGPGFYVNWMKVLGSWLVFLFWVGSADWISRDAVEMKLDYMRWNPVVVFTFLAAFVALWLVPIFWVGFPLVVLAYVVPLVAYVVHRNGRVQEHQRVLTPAHIRYWLAERFSRVGVKMEAEARDPHQVGAPVVLAAVGGTERDMAARVVASRQSQGTLPARRLLADALYRRADAVMLDYTQQAVGLRYLIDGVWQNGEPMERETGDLLLEALKLISGLNPQDRQARQEGKFAIDYHVFKPIVFAHVERGKEEYRKRVTLEAVRELAGSEVNPAEIEQRAKLMAEERVRERFASPIGTWTPVEKTDLGRLRSTERVNPENCLDPMRCVCPIASQGTATGERVIIQLEVQKTRFATLDEIGMRPKMQEQLKELMHEQTGLLVFSAPQGAGLRTTMNVVLRTADRFMREFAAVEEENNRFEAVENVPVTTYSAAGGQSPASVLQAVFHREPHVFVLRDFVNADSGKMVLQQAEENRLCITTARAKDGVEAVFRVLATGVAAADLARPLRAVFNQRLVRRLCDNCKEAYAPPAQVLAQLGLPPGRVQAFYRPPTQREEVCPECGGVGYRGRTAVIELLLVDDEFRKLLAAQANPDALRDAARKAGTRTLQEEGVVLVAKGVTSLPELIRVLKQ
jgi:type II secretory ATPase GspE/PulE/Tfp pilus assembly ATPase PilB-like protein